MIIKTGWSKAQSPARGTRIGPTSPLRHNGKGAVLMGSKPFLRVVFALVLLFAVSLVSSVSLANSAPIRLKHVATFVGGGGYVGFEPGKVVVFTDIRDEKGDKEFKQNHPKWNGEPEQADVYTWNAPTKQYQKQDELFVPGQGGIWDLDLGTSIEDRISRTDKTDLDISSFSWRSLIPKDERVKGYASADINGDGTKDIVVLSRVRKVGPDGYSLPAIIRVLAPSSGGYHVAAEVSLDWSKWDGLIMFETEDVNRDRVPEILVLSRSTGGSGYSVVLDMYAKDVGQHYIKAY